MCELAPDAAEGLVVAPHQAAADAGARALAAGGTAVDAAVAAAFAMAVVDPAGCGLAGYGGFLVYSPAAGTTVAVDFNTWVPTRVRHPPYRVPGDTSEPLEGGGSVAPPAVAAGLLSAHARFGRRPLAELVEPAVGLARDGFPIGQDLARAFSDHWNRTGGGAPSFAAVFYRFGVPPELGASLVQTDLAETLAALGRDGLDAIRRGPIVDAICDAARVDGGFLEPEDFAENRTEIAPAESGVFDSATVYGPSRETSGMGVIFPALASIAPDRLGPNRGHEYVTELVRALGGAWKERMHAAAMANHTTHLCAADAAGGLVSLTFTHGPRRFGSGLVATETGLVLNSGMNLVSLTSAGPRAVTNMAPVVIETATGARHAVGSVGGARIPGVVLSSIMDVVHYGFGIAEAIAAPRLSIRPLDGVLEAETQLFEQLGADEPCLAMRAGIEFGPTCGISEGRRGWVAGPDPRFETGVARG